MSGWADSVARKGVVVRDGVVRDSEDGAEYVFTARECFRNGTHFGELVGRTVYFWLDKGRVDAVNARVPQGDQ